MDKPKIETLPTGIDVMDKEVLSGGIPKNHVILVTGTAGTMKSSLCFQIAYVNVLNGKNAVYITLEQSAISIVTQMGLMGFDLSKINIDSNNTGIKKIVEKPGKGSNVLFVLDVGYIRATEQATYGEKRFFEWFEHIKTQLDKSGKKFDIVVFDSLTALYHMDVIEPDARKLLLKVYDYLKKLDTTTLLINEMQTGDTRVGYLGVESFLVDGVILLAMEKREFSVIREIQVVKMRFVNQNTDIYVLKFDPKKTAFTMTTKLTKE